MSQVDPQGPLLSTRALVLLFVSIVVGVVGGALVHVEGASASASVITGAVTFLATLKALDRLVG